MKTNKWIQDLKNSTKDQGIKDDINKLIIFSFFINIIK
jgi:hypothetical protein